MKTYEKTKTSRFTNFKTKAVKGYKRFSVFANATALAVVASNAIKDVLPEIKANAYNLWTVVLSVSAVLIAITAAVIYIKFFTDDAE